MGKRDSKPSGWQQRLSAAKEKAAQPSAPAASGGGGGGSQFKPGEGLYLEVTDKGVAPDVYVRPAGGGPGFVRPDRLKTTVITPETKRQIETSEKHYSGANYAYYEPDSTPRAQFTGAAATSKVSPPGAAPSNVIRASIPKRSAVGRVTDWAAENIERMPQDYDRAMGTYARAKNYNTLTYLGFTGGELYGSWVAGGQALKWGGAGIKYVAPKLATWGRAGLSAAGVSLWSRAPGVARGIEGAATGISTAANTAKNAAKAASFTIKSAPAVQRVTSAVAAAAETAPGRAAAWVGEKGARAGRAGLSMAPLVAEGGVRSAAVVQTTQAIENQQLKAMGVDVQKARARYGEAVTAAEQADTGFFTSLPSSYTVLGFNAKQRAAFNEAAGNDVYLQRMRITRGSAEIVGMITGGALGEKAGRALVGRSFAGSTANAFSRTDAYFGVFQKNVAKRMVLPMFGAGMVESSTQMWTQNALREKNAGILGQEVTIPGTSFKTREMYLAPFWSAAVTVPLGVGIGSAAPVEKLAKLPGRQLQKQGTAAKRTGTFLNIAGNLGDFSEWLGDQSRNAEERLGSVFGITRRGPGFGKGKKPTEFTLGTYSIPGRGSVKTPSFNVGTLTGSKSSKRGGFTSPVIVPNFQRGGVSIDTPTIGETPTLSKQSARVVVPSPVPAPTRTKTADLQPVTVPNDTPTPDIFEEPTESITDTAAFTDSFSPTPTMTFQGVLPPPVPLSFGMGTGGPGSRKGGRLTYKNELAIAMSMWGSLYRGNIPRRATKKGNRGRRSARGKR